MEYTYFTDSYVSMQSYIDYWNPLSDFLRISMVPDANLQVSKRAQTVINALTASSTKLKTIRKLNNIVDDFATERILPDVEQTDGKYRVRFKSEVLKNAFGKAEAFLNCIPSRSRRRTVMTAGSVCILTGMV